ncbi:MAG TPA: hypothetical protein VEP90_18950 [Methylomirabilota bacterium]|nr:hypothetical protein [Methylomirabilota bacterium]
MAPSSGFQTLETVIDLWLKFLTEVTVQKTPHIKCIKLVFPMSVIEEVQKIFNARDLDFQMVSSADILMITCYIKRSSFSDGGITFTTALFSKSSPSVMILTKVFLPSQL